MGISKFHCQTLTGVHIVCTVNCISFVFFCFLNVGLSALLFLSATSTPLHCVRLCSALIRKMWSNCEECLSLRYIDRMWT